MASNITDLGGATLDLSGGTYLISAPLVIPPGVGNAQIVRGTLRAASGFPSDRWLVEIGSAACAPKLPNGKPDGQGSCNEFINLSEMMFDASHVAAGGVRVAKVMGTTLGPSVFFTGFRSVGVRIDNGHEVMLSEAWLAECYWSANGPCTEKADSIAVQINGNDHYLTDVIVFDYAHVGVEVNGAANVLQAVHALASRICEQNRFATPEKAQAHISSAAGSIINICFVVMGTHPACAVWNFGVRPHFSRPN